MGMSWRSLACSPLIELPQSISQDWATSIWVGLGIIAETNGYRKKRSGILKLAVQCLGQLLE